MVSVMNEFWCGRRDTSAIGNASMAHALSETVWRVRTSRFAKSASRPPGIGHNKKALPGQKITHFEVQEWVRGFRANLSDPEHGKVTDRIIVAIEPVSTTAKKELRESY